MTIEEKVRAYDEALKAAIAAHKDEDRHLKATLERIFPELKESKDEKIRNQIINFIEEYGNPIHCEWQKDWIDWLEKQDKQNPCETCSSPRLNCQNFPCEKKKNFDFSNKVEPKFHEGDWVVYKNDICQIVKREEGCNKLVTIFGIEKELVNERNLSTARLWTIQDAKDGDVLACNNGWTCIFKTLVNDETFSSYCFMDNTKWFCETGSECHTLKEEFVKAYNGKIYPATKEQRDTLMKAMADAGYTFDFEKKELKKIEQKPAKWSEEDELQMNAAIDICKNLGYTPTSDWLKSLKDKVQPKQEWSEEDKDYYDAIITKLEVTKDDALLTNNQMEFLKSLNGKIQSKQEWSEEDERMLHNLLECLRRGWRKLPADILKYESWLKSLRPQNHWKPTDAQLRCLSYAISSINTYEAKHFELQKLYNELKQLK